MSAEKKVHWTQTPEGKKRLSEQVKKQHKTGKRKPRTKATSIPLDAIPDRQPKRKKAKQAKLNTPMLLMPCGKQTLTMNFVEAYALLKALRDVFGE